MLEGRVAIVTGAGNGIGRAEARGLAAQGARVVVNDIGTSPDGHGFSTAPAESVVKEIISNGGSAVANFNSVAVEKEAENIIKTAIDKFGRLDVLVNNAGVVKDPLDIDLIPTEEWDIQVKTHLFGDFYCMRAACAWMKKQGYGRIINTSSHTGLGWKGFAPYSAAKEGIIGLTRTAARDMAEYGITINAIRPIAAWRGIKEKIDRVAKNRPEDVASLVIFLASEKAGHINGCIFEVWKGHVGIFIEPPPVQQVLRKDGSWTPEELAEKIPLTLTIGRSGRHFSPVIGWD